MKFRPCIDLHQGKVKQIVGSTLREDGQAKTNFETDAKSSYFASLYKAAGMAGGHVIMLGPGNEEAALDALAAYPGGMQVGGGINPSNAKKYLDAGASHVIVTSYVFKDGKIDFERLKELVAVVTKDRLVLDLSCKKKTVDGPYYVVTDRWEKFTDFPVTKENVELLAGFCNEFLVHAVDVEGKRQGMLEDLVQVLGEWSPIPVTYAGGARSIEDLDLANDLGKGRVDITIGSALDIFGGDLEWTKVVAWHNAHNAPSTSSKSSDSVQELCDFIKSKSPKRTGGMTASAIKKAFETNEDVESLLEEGVKRNLLKKDKTTYHVVEQ